MNSYPDTDEEAGFYPDALSIAGIILCTLGVILSFVFVAGIGF